MKSLVNYIYKQITLIKMSIKVHHEVNQIKKVGKKAQVKARKKKENQDLNLKKEKIQESKYILYYIILFY